MDFGHALVKLNGVQRKVAFGVMALPYSDAVLVQAFEHECAETFWEGHVQAFGFFGGVPPPHTGPLPRWGRGRRRQGAAAGGGTSAFGGCPTHWQLGSARIPKWICHERAQRAQSQASGKKTDRAGIFPPLSSLGSAPVGSLRPFAAHLRNSG